MPVHSWRRRNAQALYESHAGPNMTPMVDVVMVILIFFMASTAFLGPEWFLRTHLPTTGAAASGEQPTRLHVVLSVGPEKQTVAAVGVLSGLSMEQLEAKISEEVARATADKVVVLVDPGEGVAWDEVVRVHEICARLGVGKVGLQ